MWYKGINNLRHLAGLLSMIFKGVIVFTTPMMEGNKNESNKRVHLIYAVMGADAYRGTQQNSCRFWGGLSTVFLFIFYFYY